MTTTLSTYSSAIAERHLANMIQTLNHRIEVARANHDLRLLELLEHEKRQLESSKDWSVHSSGLLAKCVSFLQKSIQVIDNTNKLHIEKVIEPSGEIWWYAHDPRTGKTLWAESELEVVKWIEDNNLGR